MGFSMNLVVLQGRLGKDVEIRATTNGTQVGSVSIATTKGIKKQDGTWDNKTSWHNLVIWGKLCETYSKYLKKGKNVLVKGELEYQDYTDKNGVKRRITNINVNEIVPVESGAGNNNSSAGYSSEPRNNYSHNNMSSAVQEELGGEEYSANYENDDLPF